MNTELLIMMSNAICQAMVEQRRVSWLIYRPKVSTSVVFNTCNHSCTVF